MLTELAGVRMLMAPVRTIDDALTGGKRSKMSVKDQDRSHVKVAPVRN